MTTPLTCRALQISIMIGWMRKNNRADVTAPHVRHARNCIRVSNLKRKNVKQI